MAATTERESYTPEQLAAELSRRFGPDPMAWAFRCPGCGDVATGQDFRDAVAQLPEDDQPRDASAFLGQMCIGRLRGALDATRWRGWATAGKPAWDERGCDWTAFGLFGAPGGIWVEVAPGRKVQGFPIADAPRKEEG